MPRLINLHTRGFVVLMLLLAIAGCSSMGQIQTQTAKSLAPETLSDAERGWWGARFHVLWPPAEEPSWHVDLILAHQIVLPVLQQHRGEIDLWRFHRRAARDAQGHRFSFLFYASPAAASDIFHTLMNDALLDRLKYSGLILKDVYDDPGIVAKPNIEDTSDPHWPDVVRRNWPYYIMGVSHMWMNMIAEIAAQQPDRDSFSTISELVAFYQNVNTSLNEMWREDGRHAFLHHLNALFGYEPLIYWEKRMLTF